MNRYNVSYFHEGEFLQISLKEQDVKNINYYNTDNYLKHYDDYCKFFDTVVLKQDNFLSWIQKNKAKSTKISFVNILVYGIKDTIVQTLSAPPSGWEWKQLLRDNTRYILSFNYFLKDNYVDRFGRDQIDDQREYIDFHYFYNKKGKKILEFCKHDSNIETAKKLGKIIYGSEKKEITIPIQNFLQSFSKHFTKQRVYNRINFNEITKILMNNLNDTKFMKIANFLGKCAKLDFSYEKRTRVVVNFSYVEQENFTQYFFDNFFASSEGAFDSTSNKYYKQKFYGETLFLTGFPTPFTPPYVITEFMGKKIGQKGKQEKKQTFIDKWIRIKQHCIDYDKNNTGFDLWILESDLKRFFKNIFQKINDPRKIKKISNCVLGLEEEVFETIYTEENLEVPLEENLKVSSDTLYEDEDDDLEDWEKADVLQRIEEEGQQYRQRERQEMKSMIESEIKNNKDILFSLSRIQSLKDGIRKTNSLFNKLNTYIKHSENVVIDVKFRPYYNVWWFLSFGLNFFTHDKGIIVGGGGNKSAFYLKGSDKWLAKGHFEFIYKEAIQCLDRFQSLLAAIKSTKKLLGTQQYLEENKGNLSYKEKIKYRKSRQQKDDKQGEREQNFESLEDIISAAKQSITLFDKNTSDFLTQTYAPAIASLKLNTNNYKECSKFILSRIKVIRDNLAVEINETEEEIKTYYKEIEQIKEEIKRRIEQE